MNWLKICASLAVAIGMQRAALATLVLNTSTTTVDFNSYGGAGFAPSPAAGQLDSDDWAVVDGDGPDSDFGETNTGATLAGGLTNVAVSTGALYAYDFGGGNRAFLVQPTGGVFTQGSFYLKLQNTSGQTLSGFNIAYDLFVRNDQARDSFFNLAYQVSNLDNTVPSTGSYTPVGALDFTSPAEADANGLVLVDPDSNVLTSSRSGLINETINPGDFLYLRWRTDDGGNGSGNRDELALDNIDITGVAVVPEPSTLILAASGLMLLGWRMRRRAA